MQYIKKLVGVLELINCDVKHVDTCHQYAQVHFAMTIMLALVINH